MSENDLIAEYIKEKYPELLDTADFAFYKLGVACREFVLDLRHIFDGIDYSKLSEELKDEE